MEKRNIEIISEYKVDFFKSLEKMVNFVLDEHLINNVCFVTISFINSEETIEINKKYRGKDTDTDVISFEYNEQLYINKPEDDEILNLGDIFISYEYAKKQAAELSNTFEDECIFLVLHAMLHLLGYDHIEKNDEEIMISMQKKIFNKFKG